MTRVGRMPLVCAHRGASLQLPDNSLPAFAAAIAAGADMIETDVRMGPDGRLVLAHDPWDIVEGVATLAALLELAQGRVALDLEIVEPDLERAVLDELDGFSGTVLITSVYGDVLRRFADLAPTLPRGLVVEAPYPGCPYDGDPLATDPFAMAQACDAGVLLVEDELADAALLAVAGGRPLWVWTINAPDRLAFLLAHPAVTGVITDDPARALEVRATHVSPASTHRH